MLARCPPGLVAVLVGLILLPVGVGGAPGARPPPPISPPGGVRTSALFDDGPLLGRIAINVTNPSSGPTGTFEDEVVLDSELYANLINANFSNVEAVYAGTLAPIWMWIEANATNSSTGTILWLRLGSIPAGGSEIIFLDCAPKTAFELSESGYVGENPLLSARYAEFDNGWRVFDLYDNFSEATISSIWTLSGGWYYTLSHGFSVDDSELAGSSITSRATFYYPDVIDFEANTTATESRANGAIVEGAGSSACTACLAAAAAGWAYGSASSPSTFAANVSASTEDPTDLATDAPAVYTTELRANGSVTYLYDYQPVPGPDSFFDPPSPEPVALALAAPPYAVLPAEWTTYWIRERPWVPDVTSTVVGSTGPFSAGLQAFPDSIELNDSVTLITSVEDGIGPFHFTYSDLPPGCVSQNATSLTCVPGAPGAYRPEVVVVDAVGETWEAMTNLTVENPAEALALEGYLLASPAIVPTNSTFTLLALGAGGRSPYTYTFSNLPSTCPQVTGATAVCWEGTPGTYTFGVTIADAAGGEVEANATVLVEPSVLPLLTVTLLALPEQVPVNGTITLFADAGGGTPPYTYRYTGLPSYCASADQPVLTCSEPRSGSFEAVVDVSDAAGQQTSGQAEFVVVSATGGTVGAATSSAPGGAGPWIEGAYLLLAVAFALEAAVAFTIVRSAYRARQRPRPPAGGPSTPARRR